MQEDINSRLENGKGMDGNRNFVHALIRDNGMRSSGEFEEKRLAYEELKPRWVNEAHRYTGNFNWELNWPFRYPDLCF